MTTLQPPKDTGARAKSGCGENDAPKLCRSGMGEHAYVGVVENNIAEVKTDLTN